MSNATIVGANFIEKDNKILLIQESFSHRIESARGKWNLPAGRLDPNENIFTCAKREGEEETGLKSNPSYLIGIYEQVQTDKNVFVFVFKSDIIGGELKVSTEEDARWFSFEEVAELLKKGALRDPYIEKVIKDYKSGKKFPLELIRL
jgi:ADP-ribose pyrophosphatase YjhB (NUDIX family)